MAGSPPLPRVAATFAINASTGQYDQTPTVEVRTPATPGVWSVSHQDLDSFAKVGDRYGPNSTSLSQRFELVTEVTFCWTQKANSAFVTGTFNAWEVTIPMSKVTTTDGTEVWVAVKVLPPGDYQYKYIIDNVWRHAPDQPTTHDERGIVNNCLSVKLESCGDATCFCSCLQEQLQQQQQQQDRKKEREAYDRHVNIQGDHLDIAEGKMTPDTTKKFQKMTGVAYKYTEHSTEHNFPKTFMHNHINDRPFDVTVVSVHKLADLRLQQEAVGTISRVSSIEDMRSKALRYDPSLQLYQDAAYAAALRNQGDESMPRTAPNRASISVNDPVELAFSVRSRLSSPRLGFNPKECHEGVLLTDSNHCAIRMQEKGLYKTVRGASPIPPGGKVYFEMFAIQPSSGGGVCVGLSTRELPLSCLVGTRPNSIGFSSSGNLIRTVDGKESWTDFGTGVVDNLCRFSIGALVELRNREPGSSINSSMNSSSQSIHGNADIYDDGDESHQADFTSKLIQDDLIKNGKNLSINDDTSNVAVDDLPPPVGANGETDAPQSGSDKVSSKPVNNNNNNNNNINNSNNSNASNGVSDTHNTHMLPELSAKITFYVDGHKVGDVNYSFIGSLEVFPTLSLFARNSRVFAVFGAGDVMHADCLPVKDVRDIEGNLIAHDEASIAWKTSIGSLENLCQVQNANTGR
eukprot:CAMPEP_0184695146 /NCGR_PEP_ID=MMETSP0313-20130426/2868_1 /TAXON_ID=2792 /ORGANISM="Porphyridium aerugineum, Strain SAG 1380-2" /LENGTH=687 /DNA_ID=CAMNT_0027153549 /DNA_START=474 /DNA_END=2537 /DNA_ORIENTATION=+